MTGDDIVVLSAMDPANPYGALVPWPLAADPDKAKPRRVAGAWVMLARGRPVLWVGSNASSLITFPETIRDEEGSLDAAIEMLRHLPKARGMLVIRKVDGVDVTNSPMLPRFLEAGFATDYRGLVDTRVPGAAAG